MQRNRENAFQIHELPIPGLTPFSTSKYHLYRYPPHNNAYTHHIQNPPSLSMRNKIHSRNQNIKRTPLRGDANPDTCRVDTGR